MHRIVRIFTSLTLGITIQTCAFASPKQLVTHNLTDYESNAFIAGVIPSQYPTKAHSTGKVFWGAVRMACFGHIINDKCSAVIKVQTDTDQPIEVGLLELNVETGEISPEVIRGNGYTVTITGLAEATISKDN
jgi:hypothetical protein